MQKLDRRVQDTRCGMLPRHTRATCKLLDRRAQNAACNLLHSSHALAVSHPLPIPQTQDTWRGQGRRRVADTCLHNASYVAFCCTTPSSACAVEGWMRRDWGSSVGLRPLTLSTVSLRPRHCEHHLSFDCALSAMDTRGFDTRHLFEESSALV